MNIREDKAIKAWEMASRIWHDTSIPNIERQERINGCLLDCLGYVLGTRDTKIGYEDKKAG